MSSADGEAPPDASDDEERDDAEDDDNGESGSSIDGDDDADVANHHQLASDEKIQLQSEVQRKAAMDVVIARKPIVVQKLKPLLAKKHELQVENNNLKNKLKRRNAVVEKMKNELSELKKKKKKAKRVKVYARDHPLSAAQFAAVKLKLIEAVQREATEYGADTEVVGNNKEDSFITVKLIIRDSLPAGHGSLVDPLLADARDEEDELKIDVEDPGGGAEDHSDDVISQHVANGSVTLCSV